MNEKKHVCSDNRILFAGDPHGDFNAVRVAADLEPTAIILLGDFQLQEPLDEAVGKAADMVWWISGNHEGDRWDWYNYCHASTLANRCIDGRVIEIDGVRIAGLGGVFRRKIWDGQNEPRFGSRADYLKVVRPSDRPSDGGIPLRHRTTIWWEDVERLSREQADVLVVHEAPQTHPHGYEVIGWLAVHMGVDLIVHGHHHDHYQAQLPGSNIRVVGVGEAEVVNGWGQGARCTEKVRSCCLRSIQN